MGDRQQLVAIAAGEVLPSAKASNNPEPYASQTTKREKSRIGGFSGLKNSGARPPVPSKCAGFLAGGEAHHLVNHTDKEVVFLKIGNQATGDEVNYPNNDLQAVMGQEGRWQFGHNDGTPY
ncbi:cupin [Candidatus Poribacteria bacterium]|nr:cupin [Gammaproteobacteria bacterium]MYF99200.1 cupin [Candidatus Poribacteria bacterium]